MFLGVVHLASTESTGGSTTGDDEESSDQQPSNVDRVLLETKRNTHQNESIANSYRQAQEKLGFSDSQPENNGGAMPQSNSLYPQSLLSYPPRSKRRNKSPSDLEADDENDHDSLNHSDSQTGSNLSLAGPSTVTTTVTTASTSDKASVSLNNSSTPRPTTPTGNIPGVPTNFEPKFEISKFVKLKLCKKKKIVKSKRYENFTIFFVRFDRNLCSKKISKWHKMQKTVKVCLQFS